MNPESQAGRAETPTPALLPFNISQAINSFENAAFACGMAHSNDEWHSAKAGLDAERRTLNGYITEMGASLERRLSHLTTQNAELAGRKTKLLEAAEMGQNTIRSLIHTLRTIDADEQHSAREEKRPARVHTREIKQAQDAHDKLNPALSTPPKVKP